MLQIEDKKPLDQDDQTLLVLLEELLNRRPENESLDVYFHYLQMLNTPTSQYTIGRGGHHIWIKRLSDGHQVCIITERDEESAPSTTDPKPTHTPGPWRIDIYRPKGRGPERFTVISDTAEEWIVQGKIQVAQDRPNLALISAAPELLEALDYLLEQTVDMDLNHGIGLTEGEEDARDKAIAAIAKARGVN